jgi:hypothetical protein
LKRQSFKQAAPRQKSSGSQVHSRARSASPVKWNCDWIPSLAEPYLRGYEAQFESGKSLLGYRFFAAPIASSMAPGKKSRSVLEVPSAGFFIGYLLDARGLPFLKAAPPEFLAFCFIEPVGGGFHRLLVSAPDSLMRRTAEYIRWLTHHPPRFELYADDRAPLVRHIAISAWPADRIEHYARNFSIETLAWLVRSALVRRLPDELAASIHPGSATRASTK